MYKFCSTQSAPRNGHDSDSLHIKYRSVASAAYHRTSLVSVQAKLKRKIALSPTEASIPHGGTRAAESSKNTQLVYNVTLPS